MTNKLSWIAIAVAALAVAACAQPLSDNVQSGNSIDIHADIGFPMSPQPFSDFWKMGIGAGGGLTMPFLPATKLKFLADFRTFALDETSFFKGLDIQPAGNSVSGARTTLLTFSANIGYHPGDINTSPFIFGGGMGFLFTIIGAGKADYKGYVITQESESHFKVFLTGLFGIEFKLTALTSMYIGAQYLFAIGKNDRANTDVFSLVVGSEFPL